MTNFAQIKETWTENYEILRDWCWDTTFISSLMKRIPKTNKNKTY